MIYIYIYMYIHIYLYISTYIHIFIYIHINMYIHVRVYTHACAYMCVFIYRTITHGDPNAQPQDTTRRCRDHPLEDQRHLQKPPWL